MQADREKILSFDEKKYYSIDPSREAFCFYLDKVIEERCDEFDLILEDDHFEIVDREYETIAANIFNYKVICFK